ncbi:MAG: hypothetical protein ACR2NX_14675 [Chthoniobacterales bacterium]
MKWPPSLNPVLSCKSCLVRLRFLRPDVACADATWTQTGAIQHGRDMGPRQGPLMLVCTQEAGTWAVAVMHNMDLLVSK